jgi:tetratricopeptide (TPR) repeat protein
MQEDNPLQRAISAARNGHELTARDMFLDIVKAQPQNEVAWMWLTGLFDNLDDCIYACKKALEINPNNTHARQYLSQLLDRKEKETEAEAAQAEEQVRAAREWAKLNKPEASLDMVRSLTKQKTVSADAWRLLAELSPGMNEQIQALEKLLEVAPEDASAANELRRLKHFQENPLDLAMLYEEQGKLDEAIKVYSLAAQNPNLKQQWNRIYWKIVGLENLQQEQIAHISPAVAGGQLIEGAGDACPDQVHGEFGAVVRGEFLHTI